MREQYKTYIDIYNEAASLNNFDGKKIKIIDLNINF